VGATTVLSEVIPGWDVTGEGTRERLDPELLARAYRYSERAHEGQTRSSGDPYVSHCVEVAKILAELQLDSVTVAAGLIHDVVEDTVITVADVEREFGPEIAQIVDGLTKIGNLPMHSKEERQVENYRKLLLSVAKDARVILIKLADRLHNMRTLDYLAPEKRRRIAQETRDLYAPLAHRFGMARVRWELEDLAFKHMEPEEYRALAKLVATKRGEREALISQLREPLERQLREPASQWSRSRAAEAPVVHLQEDEAARQAVRGHLRPARHPRARRLVPECYHALGVIHEWWTPLRSASRTTSRSPSRTATSRCTPRCSARGAAVRDPDPHARHAPHGGLRHRRALALQGELVGRRPRPAARVVPQVLELQLDATDPGEFLEFLKLDLYQDEIFVFTPTGDVIQLPKGATPIDFAFAVHTQVGLHCAGAKVNGRIAPLARQLKNSETVEILTAPVAKPSRDWLAHVRTSRARHKIRQWLRQEEEKTAATVGREILDRELRRRKLPKPDDAALAAAAKQLKLSDVGHLIASVGQGDVGVVQLLRILYPEIDPAEEPKPASAFERLVDRVRGNGTSKGVRIQGPTGSWCATPSAASRSPGPGGGLRDARARGEHPPRRLPEPADAGARARAAARHRLAGDAGERFTVRLTLEGSDRRGLYADVAGAVTGTGTDIRQLDLRTNDGRAAGALVVEVENLAHLQKIIRSVRRIKGINEVARRERLDLQEE
jgi:GTP pyrophosphokinase